MISLDKYKKIIKERRGNFEDLSNETIKGILWWLYRDTIKEMVWGEEETEYTYNNFIKTAPKLVDKIGMGESTHIFLDAGAQFSRSVWRVNKIFEIKRFRDMERNFLENLESILLILDKGDVETAKKYIIKLMKQTRRIIEESEDLEWNLTIIGDEELKKIKIELERIKKLDDNRRIKPTSFISHKFKELFGR
ncbi:MAG TPA: hypothetical protein VGD31_17345 [Sphingobacteriaceae bacterium]